MDPIKLSGPDALQQIMQQSNQIAADALRQRGVDVPAGAQIPISTDFSAAGAKGDGTSGPQGHCDAMRGAQGTGDGTGMNGDCKTPCGRWKLVLVNNRTGERTDLAEWEVQCKEGAAALGEQPGGGAGTAPGAMAGMQM